MDRTPGSAGSRVPALVLVLVVGFPWLGVRPGAQRAYSPLDVEDGQRLYLNACTNCHGPEGNAVPGIDLGRGQFRRASSDNDLIEIVRRGIPGTAMPPGNYSNTAATQIVAYLRAMAAGGTTPTAIGDARRGRAVFEGKGQCLTCHQVNGIGSRLGPDLSEVGRLGRASEIEQAVLDPRREVLPQNRTVTVTTPDGARVSGRLLHHDTFIVLLLDSEENLRSFDKSNVRDVTVIKTNPMPSYRPTLTDQEVADLVGYLVSLKGTRAMTP